MIDHLTFGVSQFGRPTSFYDAALAPLSLKRLFDVPQDDSGGVADTGYGDLRPFFWVAEPAAVDEFYAAALAVGGRDNGPPGLRVHYHPTYYGAFVLDPDGHNIEAVCHAAPSA